MFITINNKQYNPDSNLNLFSFYYPSLDIYRDNYKNTFENNDEYIPVAP